MLSNGPPCKTFSFIHKFVVLMLVEIFIPYFLGYKTEFLFPSKTIPKI